MLLAFATGLSVDWLSEGLIGINAAALVPVALMRKPLIRFFLGEDIITRSDSFSFRKNGVVKISFILLISTVIFLGIYIFLDGAGTRPTWFNLTRVGVSLACNYVLALIVTNILTVDDRK
jgi:quinol-cytochrome oxidoreductase complex cytochrome b subunit